MSNSHDAPIPLLSEGDAWEIYVDSSAPAIHVLSILRLEGNTNTTPVETKYFDLTPDVRVAVLRQIQRRYPGRMVRV